MGNTLSKSARYWTQDCPTRLVRSQAGWCWSSDGERYVDTSMALGAVMVGHAEPIVAETMRQVLSRGWLHSLAHPLEERVAEQICGLVPFVEQVRFVKTGSEALQAACRVARAATGRDLVVVDNGYHGWHDWFIIGRAPAAGVPHAWTSELVTLVPNRDGQVASPPTAAAVVVEPDRFSPYVLRFLADACERSGTLLIFDEVVTGFRVGPGGWAQQAGIVPDLVCYGKALANGMPLAAVCGGREIMRTFEDVFVSGTHAGETLSLAAAAATLHLVEEGVLDQVAERARILWDGLANERTTSSYPQRIQLDLDLTDRSIVQQQLARAGILYNGSLFACARHAPEDLQRVVEIVQETVFHIRDFKLDGPPIDPMFR